MKKIIFLTTLILISTVAQAQYIYIDSDKQLEWYRDEQKIIAVGNAIATKEKNVLKGDKITAFYEKVQLEDGSKKTQIQKIYSDGNVSLQMNKALGTGSFFEYNLPTQTATLKGKPAKIKNQTGELTATGSIIYYGAENKSIALGNVIAKNEDYTIFADKMISFFDVDKQGKRTLNRVEIFANTDSIKLVNQQSVVTGQRGTYFPIENKLKIFDNVVINQNDNILKGDYAETDLTTGISRLLASQNQGRVSGIFHNKKKD